MAGGSLRGQEWDSYLRAPVSTASFLEYRKKVGAAFNLHASSITALLRKLEPQCVVCLGAGYLLDIPLETLLESASKSVLVDWIPGVSIQGFAGSVIRGQGGFRCLLCKFNHPENFCGAFEGPLASTANVCEAFRAVEDPGLRCSNYLPGPEPRFMVHDVTMGRATEFATRAFKFISSCNTPEQAFHKAINACRRASHTRDRIPVGNGSVDLVTSSMVASQFDSEPYTYFSRLLERKFGSEYLLAQEEKLSPLMNELRGDLFRIQMDGHADEIYRLVNKDHGRAYFSVELFRTLPKEEDGYFLVHEIPAVFQALSRYFYFDFETISPAETLRSAPMGKGTSIVQCYVLAPKPLEEVAAGV